MELLTGKRLVLAGPLHRGSLGHAVAAACRRHGAELALLCTNEDDGADAAMPPAGVAARVYRCGLSTDAALADAIAWLSSQWPHVDGLFHALAPSRPANGGDGADALSRAGFWRAHESSSHRFAALARAALPLLRHGASLVTATHAGARRAMPGANVDAMAHASLEASVRYLAAALGPRGVRVNAVSAGPLHAGVAGEDAASARLLRYVERAAPLRRAVRADEVANLAAFLLSDLASGITAQVCEVDAGFGSVVAGLNG